MYNTISMIRVLKLNVIIKFSGIHKSYLLFNTYKTTKSNKKHHNQHDLRSYLYDMYKWFSYIAFSSKSWMILKLQCN